MPLGCCGNVNLEGREGEAESFRQTEHELWPANLDPDASQKSTLVYRLERKKSGSSLNLIFIQSYCSILIRSLKVPDVFSLIFSIV